MTYLPGTAGFYIEALDIADREAIEAAATDAMCDAALTAICHAVDGVATAEDQQALLAWGTRLRLTGFSETEVNTLMSVADHILAQL